MPPPSSDEDAPLPMTTASSLRSNKSPVVDQHSRSASTADSDARGTAFRHRRSASLALAARQQHEQDASPLHTPLPAMDEIPLDDPAPTAGLAAFYERNKGLAYVLLAQFFGVLMNVTTRVLELEGNKGAGMEPLQILLVRMSITTSLSIAYMWYAQTAHFPLGLPEVRWALVVRGIGGFFGVFGMYYSLMYLPLADATVVTFISPILSNWACSFVINEPFTRMEQLGAFVSFAGVILIARPTTFFDAATHASSPPPPQGAPADAAIQPPAQPALHLALRAVADFSTVTGAQRFMAICMALLGVLGQSTAFTAMRWIGKRAHPLLSVTYFCACCTIVSATAMAVLPGMQFILPADLKEWAYLIFLGICGFAMQFLLSAGLQHEKSGRATNMTYTQMLFALLFDKVVFGTNPTLLSLAGSALISGSAIYVAMYKDSAKAQANDTAKRNPARGGIELQETSGRYPRRHSRTTSLALREERAGLVAGMDTDEDEFAADAGSARSRGG